MSGSIVCTWRQCHNLEDDRKKYKQLKCNACTVFLRWKARFERVLAIHGPRPNGSQHPKLQGEEINGDSFVLTDQKNDGQDSSAIIPKYHKLPEKRRRRSKFPATEFPREAIIAGDNCELETDQDGVLLPGLMKSCFFCNGTSYTDMLCTNRTTGFPCLGPQACVHQAKLKRLCINCRETNKRRKRVYRAKARKRAQDHAAESIDV